MHWLELLQWSLRIRRDDLLKSSEVVFKQNSPSPPLEALTSLAFDVEAKEPDISYETTAEEVWLSDTPDNIQNLAE